MEIVVSLMKLHTGKFGLVLESSECHIRHTVPESAEEPAGSDKSVLYGYSWDSGTTPLNRGPERDPENRLRCMTSHQGGGWMRPMVSESLFLVVQPCGILTGPLCPTEYKYFQ